MHLYAYSHIQKYIQNKHSCAAFGWDRIFLVPSVMLEEFEMTTDLIEECQIGFIGVTVTAV